jgi:tetratricopeptide (TPR) repeat protein
MTLSDELHGRVVALAEKGDDLVGEGKCAQGIDKYSEAWQLLPEPKEDWEAATWLLSAIGDAYYSAREFQDSVSAFSGALLCPGGLGNAFIHLRLGQAYWELGDSRRAQDNLARAYMAGGRDVFQAEDPKYLTFLSTCLKPPIGQDAL